ncbi:MAG TPA: MFS transporter [Thermoanaerobaculia bacterium]|nr:MFS transporter [Thermoanaerobaculia bacterium]
MAEMETPVQPGLASPVEAPRPSSRLWNRDFFLLWQGQTVSQLGSQAFLIAMAFWVKETTGSATLMGLLMTLSSLPGVLLAPFGGTFADRHSRIRIVVGCDVLAGMSSLSLGLVMLSGAASRSVVLPLLFVVTVLIGIIRSFFSPAIQAAIPDLVPPERLPAANSLNQFSVQTSVFAGQAVGGVLYRVLGAPLLFLTDGLSYLFSAVTALFITDTWKKPEAKPRTGGALREFLGETGEGLRYVWSRTGMRDFVLVACLLNFLGMPMFVLLPFYVDVLHAGADWYGFLLAAMSIGAVAGYLLAGTVRLKGATLGWSLLAGLLLGPLFFSLVGFVSIPWLALALCFASGLSLGTVNIYLITLLQASTPRELRGRVLGFLGTLAGALMPLGSALGGWLGDLTGKNIPLIFGGVGALSVLVTLLLATRSECRKFLTQGV